MPCSLFTPNYFHFQEITQISKCSESPQILFFFRKRKFSLKGLYFIPKNNVRVFIYVYISTCICVCMCVFARKISAPDCDHPPPPPPPPPPCPLLGTDLRHCKRELGSLATTMYDQMLSTPPSSKNGLRLF